MASRRSKRGLQIVIGLLGIIPVATGLLGLLGVQDPVYVAAGVPRIVLLDTNLRFYSGVWLGLGLALYWLIPAIETQTVLFRVLWAMIFLGGIGRLLSMTMLAWPPAPFVAFTAFEIVGAPLFILWQSRLSKTMTRASNPEAPTMKDQTNDHPSSRARNVLLWVLQILTAAAFLMAGFAGLSGQPMMVETFDKIGIGQRFRYVTGSIEIASAILLLIPLLTPVGAAHLVCTMTGAVLTHLVLIGGSPVPALVLLCFAAIILWGRFGTLKAWGAKLPARAVSAPKAGDAVTSPSHAR